jgi:hypothetical protein
VSETGGREGGRETAPGAASDLSRDFFEKRDESDEACTHVHTDARMHRCTDAQMHRCIYMYIGRTYTCIGMYEEVKEKERWLGGLVAWWLGQGRKRKRKEKRRGKKAAKEERRKRSGGRLVQLLDDCSRAKLRCYNSLGEASSQMRGKREARRGCATILLINSKIPSVCRAPAPPAPTSPLPRLFLSLSYYTYYSKTQARGHIFILSFGTHLEAAAYFQKLAARPLFIIILDDLFGARAPS